MMVVFSVKETRQIWMRRVGCELALTITPQLHTPVTPALAIEAHLLQKNYENREHDELTFG